MTGAIIIGIRKIVTSTFSHFALLSISARISPSPTSRTRQNALYLNRMSHPLRNFLSFRSCVKFFKPTQLSGAFGASCTS
jgi:hypothetical protein